jgi:hypothetical protein
MGRGSLLLVLSLFLFSDSAIAIDSQCIRDKFVEYLGRSTHAIGVPYFDFPNGVPQNFTIVTRIRGPRGGQQMLIRKNTHWTHPFRGDATTNYEIFGEKLSSFLGFKKISETEMVVPDAEEGNRAIEALNALIRNPKEKISTRFYTPKKDRVDPKEYSEEYFIRDRLPISYKGSEAAHDVFTHFAGAFLPEVMRTHLKRHYDAVKEFKEFAVRNYPKSNPQGLERLKAVLKRELEGTGPNVKGDYHEGFAQQADFFTALPSLSALKFEGPVALARYMPRTLARNNSPETVLRDLYRYDKDHEIRKLMERFIASKSDPIFFEEYPYSDEENRKLILERFNYLRSLVETTQ